jgi:hypothetical protein
MGYTADTFVDSTSGPLQPSAGATPITAAKLNKLGTQWEEAAHQIDNAKTTVTVVNTTTLSNLFSHAFAANELAPGDVLHLELEIDFLNNSGAAVNYTFQFAFGSTTALSTGVISMSAGANRRRAHIDVWLYCRAAADEVMAVAIAASGATAAGTLGAVDTTVSRQGSALLGEALNAAKTLAAQVQLGTAAATIDCRVIGANLTKYSTIS